MARISVVVLLMALFVSSEGGQKPSRGTASDETNGQQLCRTASMLVSADVIWASLLENKTAIDQLQSELCDFRKEVMVSTYNCTMQHKLAEYDNLMVPLRNEVYELRVAVDFVKVAVDSLHRELDKVKEDICEINEKIGRLDEKFDALDKKVDQNFFILKEELGRLDRKVDQNFYTLKDELDTLKEEIGRLDRKVDENFYRLYELIMNGQSLQKLFFVVRVLVAIYTANAKAMNQRIAALFGSRVNVAIATAVVIGSAVYFSFFRWLVALRSSKASISLSQLT